MLAAWPDRDPATRNVLVSVIYDELHRLAHRYMRSERPGHLLQTTALVNEAYLRLVDVDRMQWRDRAHFFAMAATTMRRILVDHARGRARDKRGAGAVLTALGTDIPAPTPDVDVLALDAALERLSAIDAQQARVVEFRYFAVDMGFLASAWFVRDPWLAPLAAEPRFRVVQLTCLPTIPASSNIVTWGRPKTGSNRASALMARLFVVSCRPFALM